MTNPSGAAPRPVILLLELSSFPNYFQSATFAEFPIGSARGSVMAMRARCSTGPLACLNLGAPTRPSRAMTAERPLDGTVRGAFCEEEMLDPQAETLGAHFRSAFRKYGAHTDRTFTHRWQLTAASGG